MILGLCYFLLLLLLLLFVLLPLHICPSFLSSSPSLVFVTHFPYPSQNFSIQSGNNMLFNVLLGWEIITVHPNPILFLPISVIMFFLGRVLESLLKVALSSGVAGVNHLCCLATAAVLLVFVADALLPWSEPVVTNVVATKHIPIIIPDAVAGLARHDSHCKHLGLRSCTLLLTITDSAVAMRNKCHHWMDVLYFPESIVKIWGGDFSPASQGTTHSCELQEWGEALALDVQRLSSHSVAEMGPKYQFQPVIGALRHWALCLHQTVRNGSQKAPEAEMQDIGGKGMWEDGFVSTLQQVFLADKACTNPRARCWSTLLAKEILQPIS